MSDQERQDDVGSVSDDDACWHSSRLRMARMVEPQGCDALVDHIVLYRASARSWTEQAVAIGRSLERQQTESSRVAWRLAEVMSVDILPEELDGAQIYSEPVFLKEADTVRPGTVFVPEHSIPAQRRMSAFNPSVTAADAASWFSAKVRWACMIEGLGADSFEDNIYLLRATDFDAAFKRAIAIGRSGEREFVNLDHRQTRWQLVGVLSLNLLGAGEMFDGAEVYSEEVALKDDDRVPFDTVFRPEESNPAMTIG